MRKLSVILFCCILVSCEMEVEVDVPGEPSKIVVNSVFTPDSTWFVTVHSSHHILSEISPSLDNLTVSLRDENGQEIILGDKQLFTGQQFNEIGWSYESTSRPEPGTSYEVRVTSTGFEPASAIARAPIVVEIENALLDSAGLIVDEFGQGSIPVEFTFQDPAGLGDYYYPQLIATYEYTSTDPNTGEEMTFTYDQFMFLQRDRGNSDFIDVDREGNFAMPDKAFDGELETVRLFASVYMVPGSEQPKNVRLNLHHASEDYVKYFRSMRLQGEASGNPFAQPVQVYTNVEGGLGVFAGYTRASWHFVK